jgi:hypothetical protein
MYCRKVFVSIIEETYKNFKRALKLSKSKNEFFKDEFKFFLEEYDEEIPLWCDIDASTKCAAIEYVYLNRKNIELNSGAIPAWAQAAAYFMLYAFIAPMCDGVPDLGLFFDDEDFMAAKDVKNLPSEAMDMLGIRKDFNEPF